MSTHAKKPNSPSTPKEALPFLSQLDAALKQELQFRGAAQQPAGGGGGGNGRSGSNVGGGGNVITSGMRDGSAHVLRCLKVWYDLPSEVFFNAISSIDRFLAKMKAQPKHLSCIAVSAFHLACLHLQQSGHALPAIPDPQDLVTISQSRCSPSDLLRMQAILASKLEVGAANASSNAKPTTTTSAVITPLTLLRLMFDVSRSASERLGMPDLLPECIPDHLVHQLEILSCDSLTLAHRPAEVALALLATEFQRRASAHPDSAGALMGFVAELQKYCGISAASFVQCLGVVVNQLEKYNGEGTVTHRQRLVWKLSNRTLRHLRPTDKLRATLPTIMEYTNLHRMRSNSECSEESMESLSESDYERDMEVEEDPTLSSHIN